MTTLSWQLTSPVSAIIFDCDGTLSRIEGIDELAEMNHVGGAVKSLTQTAMSQTGLNPALYQERLALVQPTQSQVVAVGQRYINTAVPQVAAVIACLQRLGKAVYVVSAGLLPSVQLLGDYLQIPRSHIHAVPISFDGQGQYLDFDHTSPLITNDGKRQIVTQLKQTHSSMVYVGDGLNDCSVLDVVTRFVGFGGVFYRENIKAMADFYLTAPSMAGLLPLCLTQAEVATLLPAEQRIYQVGVEEVRLSV